MTWRFGGVNLPTTEFELFDNVTDLLKPVSVTLLFALIVGDHLHSQSTNKLSWTDRVFFPPAHCCGSGFSHQESGSLKQKDLICFYDLCKISQVCLQLLDVWDKLVHYARPGLQRQDKKKDYLHSLVCHHTSTHTTSQMSQPYRGFRPRLMSWNTCKPMVWTVSLGLLLAP